MTPNRSTDDEVLAPVLVAAWRDAVGPTLAWGTHLIALNDRELSVSVYSPAYLAELRRLAPVLIDVCCAAGASVTTIRCVVE